MKQEEESASPSACLEKVEVGSGEKPVSSMINEQIQCTGASPPSCPGDRLCAPVSRSAKA